MLERTQVLVLGLGGTISMRDASGAGAQPSLYLAEVLDGLPGELNVDLEDLKLVPGAALVFRDVLQVADRIRRAGAEGYVGAVVVQGTDTLEEVAYALHLLVDEAMTVVVTGAMRHGSSLGADGAANIAAAVATAASSECAGLGALVVLADEIHAARFVSKTSTALPHAFASWPGSLGQVSEGRVRLALRPSVRPTTLEVSADAEIPRVEMVTARLGAGPDQLVALVADPPRGVVVAGFGGGHVPPSWVEPLTELARACPVVLSSRTGSGALLRETYGFPGSERDLLGRGLIWAGTHTAVKAVVALTLLLAAGSDRPAIGEHFAS